MTINPNADPASGSDPTYPPLLRTPLAFKGHPIRMDVEENGWWLSAGDVCRALDLPIGSKLSPAKYIRRLDNRDKDYRVVQTSQGPKLCAVLSPSGAYQLASPQRKKRGVDRQFREWLATVCPLPV